MSKQIKIPEGMLQAACNATGQYAILRDGLEAALRWLSENPISPTPEQVTAIAKSRFDDRITCIGVATGAVEWQRRMFVAPESEVPAQIKDLLLPNIESGFFKPEILNERLLEAFRRGKESK